ncbi:IS3 family transposase, partial [Salmonella enterica subsp. enterica]|nr:IS3 family transposase [Salmonella enterica subsp. enterica]
LEDKNWRFKHMFADLNLENRALNDAIEKSFETNFKHELIAHQISAFELSILQACQEYEPK